MSVVTLKLISCDVCNETYASGDTKMEPAKMQRDGYKGDGWIFKNGKDYCPDCIIEKD